MMRRMVDTLPDESAIQDALRTVDDPEAGMNIVELGLVYRIEVIDDHVEVDVTMTTPACPVADLIVDQARAAVEGICQPGTDVRVQLVWEPIWNPSMMSEVARGFFGWQG
jgi:metal-sulfur cluster biosynthetic enzyme